MKHQVKKDFKQGILIITLFGIFYIFACENVKEIPPCKPTVDSCIARIPVFQYELFTYDSACQLFKLKYICNCYPIPIKYTKTLREAEYCDANYAGYSLRSFREKGLYDRKNDILLSFDLVEGHFSKEDIEHIFVFGESKEGWEAPLPKFHIHQLNGKIEIRSYEYTAQGIKIKEIYPLMNKKWRNNQMPDYPNLILLCKTLFAGKYKVIKDYGEDIYGDEVYETYNEEEEKHFPWELY